MSDRISLLDSDLDEQLRDAIRKGLEKGDANMVKAVVELRDREGAADILKDLSVEIVPYTIKDTSLRDIVLKAPEYIIDEIYAALAERKRIAEFGGIDLDSE